MRENCKHLEVPSYCYRDYASVYRSESSERWRQIFEIKSSLSLAVCRQTVFEEATTRLQIAVVKTLHL